MHLSPDQVIFWQHGFLKLNATIAFTWALMFVLAVGSKLITRKLSTNLTRSHWQNFLEIIVTAIEKQIEGVGLPHPEKYIGFLGTLFLFVATAGICTVVPGYEPPTASLSTTVALALSVFVAVPLFGIEDQGLGGYLKLYETDVYHAAVQHHQRTLAHAGFGCPFIRQHDERRDDRRDSAHHYAFHLSHFHDAIRPAHRHGTGLYFQHSGCGLYRCRRAQPQTRACAGFGTLKQELTQLKETQWIA